MFCGFFNLTLVIFGKCWWTAFIQDMYAFPEIDQCIFFSLYVVSRHPQAWVLSWLPTTMLRGIHDKLLVSEKGPTEVCTTFVRVPFYTLNVIFNVLILIGSPHQNRNGQSACLYYLIHTSFFKCWKFSFTYEMYKI